jgi:hypothetical protein
MSETARRFPRAYRERSWVLPAARPDSASRPCVVHLVRAANGEEPFRAFVQALRNHPPGTDFDLVLAMKGFHGRGDARPYLDFAADLSPEALFFPDEGLDLGVYFGAAAALRRDRYCFLNSYSEPLVAGWLEKLDAALGEPGVGLAGATGSWASTRSWTAHVLRLPSAYRGVLPEPRLAMEQFMAMELDRMGMEPAAAQRSALATTRARIETLAEIPRQTLPYERFPAYHIRTNAFMVTHATLAELHLRPVREKHEAYLLENGRSSITRQVQRKGLRTLVVDRKGDVYDREQWPASRTFWQGDQEGLLVRDNQTRCYADADADRRRLLSGFAWGREADPTRP